MPNVLGAVMGFVIGLVLTLGLGAICLIMGVAAIPGNVPAGEENTLVTLSSTFMNFGFYLFYSSFLVAPIMAFLGYRYAKTKQAEQSQPGQRS